MARLHHSKYHGKNIAAFAKFTVSEYGKYCIRFVDEKFTKTVESLSNCIFYISMGDKIDIYIQLQGVYARNMNIAKI